MIKHSAYPKLTYDQARAQAVANAIVKIHGKPVDRPTSEAAWMKNFLPFLHCICVQDTPDNPCPCHRGPIIWVPDLAVRDMRTRPHKTADGEANVVDFDVAEDTRIVIEMHNPVNNEESATGDRVYRMNAITGSGVDSETFVIESRRILRARDWMKAIRTIDADPKLQSIARKKGPGQVAWIVAAFQAGYEIGEYLDGKWGWSDSISDWLVDTLGPLDF